MRAREAKQALPHPFLSLSEEKTATTSLQGKWLSLAGRGLPFSRFIQAVFRCPAYKYSNVGVFWLGKEKNSHFDEDSGTDAE